MKFITKKSVSITSLLFLVVYVFLQQYKISEICTINNTYNLWCSDALVFVKSFSLLIILLTIPALFTLSFKKTVFEAWRNFAIGGIPAVLFLAYFLTQGSKGVLIGPTWGEIYTLFLYGAYFLISFIIIVIAILKSSSEKTSQK